MVFISIADVRTMLTYLGIFGAGAIISSLIVIYILKWYLPSYLSEKGRNLATREDIGRITDEIEKVKVHYAGGLQNIIHQNNLLLEEVRGRHQLRLASLDRRLQTHQEAFTLWRKLLSKVHSDQIGDVVIECQNWWDKNCLYLGSEARLAFRTAYQSAFDHKDFLTDKSNTELIRENWKRIEYAGEAIVKGAELPPLGEMESEVLESVNHEKADNSTSKP